MTWHGNQRDATAAHGKALANNGWTLRGYKPDRSDSMTDYYDPASWDGLADGPDGCLILVDVNEHDAKRYREGLDVYGEAEIDCYTCRGTGREPRDVPAVLMRSIIGGAVVCEPGCKAGNVCASCEGKGRRINSHAVVGRTPGEPRAVACVGRWRLMAADGRVLATGQRALAAGHYREEERNDAITTFLRHVREALAKHQARSAAAAKAHSEAPAPAASDVAANGIVIRPGQREGIVEVVFPARPSDAVRAALKAAGFRWAGRSGCWYGAADALPACVAPQTAPQVETPPQASDAPQTEPEPEPAPAPLALLPEPAALPETPLARLTDRLASNDCEFSADAIDRALRYIADAAHRAGIDADDLAYIARCAWREVGTERARLEASGDYMPGTWAPVAGGGPMNICEMDGRELCAYVVAKLNEAAGAQEFVDGPSWRICATCDNRELGEVHSRRFGVDAAGAGLSVGAPTCGRRRRYPIADDGSFNVKAALKAFREAHANVTAAERVETETRAITEAARDRLTAALPTSDDVGEFWVSGGREIGGRIAAHATQSGLSATVTVSVNVAEDGRLYLHRYRTLVCEFGSDRTLTPERLVALMRTVARATAEIGGGEDRGTV